MKYLVVTTRKPQFDSSSIPAHRQFLEKLRCHGALEQAGPFTDASGGAYVLSAANLDEALSMVRQDPLHVQDYSTFHVREWEAR
jgi:uncharacterized protein